MIADPKVVLEPVTSSHTEKIAEEIPAVFPSCAVTRSQAKKIAKEQNSSLDTEDDIIDLSQTFMDSSEDPGSSRSSCNSLSDSSDGREESVSDIPLSRNRLVEEQENGF